MEPGEGGGGARVRLVGARGFLEVGDVFVEYAGDDLEDLGRLFGEIFAVSDEHFLKDFYGG